MIDSYMKYAAFIDAGSFAIIAVLSLLIFIYVMKLVRLSGHRGIAYFAIAHLAYAISFISLAVVKILPYCPIPTSALGHCMRLSTILFLYGVTIGSLYLVYSLAHRYIGY